MKKLLLISGAIISFGVISAQNYFSVSPQSSEIYNIELTTGETVSTQTLTLDSGPLNGFGGMSINPADNDVYVLGKTSGGQRFIGLLNLTTNFISTVINLSDKYAGLTFSETGTCYAITGDGADAPSTLYEINLLTGDEDPLADLSSEGSDGEAICFNYSDGLIYRYAGLDPDSDLGILQTIDPLTLETEVSVMDISPANYGQALYYEAGNNTLTLAAGDIIHSVNLDGSEISSISATIGDDDGYKGIILDPAFVSVSETNGSSTSKVFPNPSSGNITVTALDRTHTISVMSYDGRVVLEETMNGLQVHEINLPSGSYVLKLERLNGAIDVHKILIQ